MTPMMILPRQPKPRPSTMRPAIAPASRPIMIEPNSHIISSPSSMCAYAKQPHLSIRTRRARGHSTTPGDRRAGGTGGEKQALLGPRVLGKERPDHLGRGLLGGHPPVPPLQEHPAAGPLVPAILDAVQYDVRAPLAAAVAQACNGRTVAITPVGEVVNGCLGVAAVGLHPEVDRVGYALQPVKRAFIAGARVTRAVDKQHGRWFFWLAIARRQRTRERTPHPGEGGKVARHHARKPLGEHRAV